MKNVQAWGFLVSRNQYLDYRTVVAPDFMCEAGASSILAKAAEGDVTEEGFATYREIHNSRVGNITLVFRVIEATAENTEVSGSGVLKDSFGRDIYLIEGIAVAELIQNIIVTQETLEDNHKYLIKCYREFWDCTTPSPAIQSKPFSLSFDEISSKCLKYNKLKKYILNCKLEVDSEKTIGTKSSQFTDWHCVFSKQYESEVSSVVFFPNRDLLAIRYDPQHQKVIILNWREDEKTYEFKSDHLKIGSCPTPATISSNGQLIATAVIEACDQNVVKVLDIKTKENKSLFGHYPSILGRVFTVAFSPDNKILVSAGTDSHIKIWDVKGGGEIGTLNGHSSAVKCIKFSPDGEIIASGDGHGIIKFWKLRTRKEIFSIKASSLPINSLAFSPDSQTVASGSDDHSINLWNVKTGKAVCAIGKHSDAINSVAFSPDGKIIASAGDDQKIKIWEPKSQAEIFVLAGHTKEVNSIAFNFDSQTLVSGSKDCTIRIWQRR